MKRTTTYLLLIGVLAFAFGCKRNPAPAQQSNTAPATTPATPPTPVDPTAPATNAPSTLPVGSNAALPSVQGNPIADLPDYPGGTRMKYEVGGPKLGFSRSVETKFLTNDPFDKVKAYYAGEITKNGWTIVGQQAKFGEMEWKLSKAGSIAEIDIETERTGGVSVSLERKDR
jgi:hypothetical protein